MATLSRAQRYSIAAAALTILWSCASWARTLYVANNGNDQHPGTSLEQPLRTLNGALRVVEPGDTIELRAGSYTGATISKPGRADAWITLRPHAGERVRIFSVKPGRPTLYFYHRSCDEHAEKGSRCQALYWHVEGLEVEGSGGGGSEDYVVKIDTPWVRIVKNNLWGSSADIVKLVHTADDVQILVNEIHHPRARPGANAQGVDIVGAKRTLVAFNYVHNIPSIGMYAKGNARNTVFEHNRVENILAHGIMLGQETDAHRLRDGRYESYDGVIRNNTIRNTGWSCFASSSSYNVRIHNNSCFHTGGQLHGAVLLSNESEVRQPGTLIEIRDNIIHVSGRRPLIKVDRNALTDPTTLTLDNNLYWSTAGAEAVRFTWRDRSMEQVPYEIWRKTGRDAGSRIGDPQYADPMTLKLRPASPACSSKPVIGAPETCP